MFPDSTNKQEKKNFEKFPTCLSVCVSSFSAKKNQILHQQDFLFLHKTALSLLKQKDPIVLHAPARKSMSLFGAVNVSSGKLVNLMTRFTSSW